MTKSASATPLESVRSVSGSSEVSAWSAEWTPPAAGFYPLAQPSDVFLSHPRRVFSPAGIGILEGGLIFLFVKFAGTSQDSATALALCQRAIFQIGALPGIWIHLRADYLPKSKEEFFIDA